MKHLASAFAAALATLWLLACGPAFAATPPAAPAGFGPISVPCLGAIGEADCVPLMQSTDTVAINVATATTTRLVALSGTTKIYVTHLNVIAGGTGNITFVYGTGATCGSGTTSLSGAYNLTAQAGLSAGGGLGAVMVVPAGQSLCVTTSQAVQMSGFLTYVQR